MEDKHFLEKKRRRRTIINSKDLEKLEGLFKTAKWPDRLQKTRLSKAIGKSESFISTWFQNRRARMRRLAREKDLLDEVDGSESNHSISESHDYQKLHKYKPRPRSYSLPNLPTKDTETAISDNEDCKSESEVFDIEDEGNTNQNASTESQSKAKESTRVQFKPKPIVKMKKAPSDVKKRRRRTIINSKDLEKLEGLFKTAKWPDRLQKTRLSKAIGKSESFISTWFQNRRARMRRLAREKDLLDEVDGSESNHSISESHDYQKLHKYKPRPRSYSLPNLPTKDTETAISDNEDCKSESEVFDIEDEGNTNQNASSESQSKAKESTKVQFKPKPIVKMKKAPSDVVPSEERVFIETPRPGSPTDATSWENVFRRIIDMMAASESVMSRSDTSFPFAVKDAALGIRLKDGKLYYSKEYGLDFEDD